MSATWDHGESTVWLRALQKQRFHRGSPMKNSPVIAKLTKPLALALVAAAVLHAPGCRRSNAGDANSALAVKKHASRKTLSAFGSERELATFLKDLAEAEKRDREQREEQAKASYSQPPAGAAPQAQAAPE